MSARPLLRLLLFVLGLVLAPAALAQDARVRAQLSASLVKLGDEVRVEVTVEGTEDARLASVPEIDGLELLGVSDLRRSSFTTMVGGRRYTKTSVSWSVHLRPEREGTFELGDLQLVVDGQVVGTPVEPGALKVVRDTRGDRLGYFEAVGLPARVYEGQPFHLDLRFGWDHDMTPRFASLSLPWWGALPGILELRDTPRDASQTWLPLQVNRGGQVDVLRLAPVERGGQAFEQLQLRRRLLATRPGTLRFPQAAFEFGQLGARTPLGAARPAEEYFAVLEPFEIEVLRVPEEGRPFEWTGAVGPLEVSREVDRRDLLVGEVVRLELEWRGDANLEFFDLPDLSRLESFRGWQVLGVDDRPDSMVRRTVVELRVLSPEVEQVPGVPVWTFDTGTESYRLVTSEPVPVRVTLPEGAVLENLEVRPEDAEDLLDIDTRPRRVGGDAGPSVTWVLRGALLLLPLWLLVRRTARRHGDPSAPVERRRRAAARELQRALAAARTATDQRRALWAFLGARTRETPEAWVGRARVDLRDALGEPLPEAEAEALARLFEDLDAAVYAAGDRPVESGRIVGLTRRLLEVGL